MTSTNRYLPPDTVNALLNELGDAMPLITIGKSVNGLPIYGLKLGQGKTKVLLWSQMHGNESTTTRAIMGLLGDFKAGKHSEILNQLSLYIIPQLNPDGAKAYTRYNANAVDINRDAVALTQPESLALKNVFDQFQPHFCFNLHGQRTIFAAGKNGKPATLSFLSPAADDSKVITAARLKAMQLIAAINDSLQQDIPGHIGRYDDTFNINCVGDLFTSLDVPTILFEAGHYPEDYDRDKTLKFIRNAIIIALNSIAEENYFHFSVQQYQNIPENSKDYVDVIIEGVTIKEGDKIYNDQLLAVQHQEVLIDNKILFQPKCVAYGKKLDLIGHQKLSITELKINTLIDFEVEKTIEIF